MSEGGKLCRNSALWDAVCSFTGQRHVITNRRYLLLPDYVIYVIYVIYIYMLCYIGGYVIFLRG